MPVRGVVPMQCHALFCKLFSVIVVFMWSYTLRYCFKTKSWHKLPRTTLSFISLLRWYFQEIFDNDKQRNGFINSSTFYFLNLKKAFGCFLRHCRFLPTSSICIFVNQLQTEACFRRNRITGTSARAPNKMLCLFPATNDNYRSHDRSIIMIAAKSALL